VRKRAAVSKPGLVTLTFDLLTLKVVSESRGLPRPLCSRVIPDESDRRQTKAPLNASTLMGRGHNSVHKQTPNDLCIKMPTFYVNYQSNIAK